MKKLILTAMLALTVVTMSMAAPALPWTFTVRQADGTQLTLRQYGDEYHHWTATQDGVLVVNSRRGCYVARIADDGTLVPTPVLAHEPDRRGTTEQAAIRQQAARHALFVRRGEQQAMSRRAPAIASSGRYLPHEGSPRVLVILAAYQDVPFTVNQPVKAFDQYLNGDTQQDLGNQNRQNIVSVRGYFDASSHGRFTPQFDIVGPVTLPDSMAYYGKNENMSALCRDAVALVRDSVDFRRYDNDGDGRAELVYIIFAGYGENQGGPSEAMWAKTSTLNMTVDSTIVTRFCCGSELFHPHPNYKNFINGIGVFSHEFSHAMGLPDIYATSSTGYINNQTMERWDIMDQGIYNNNGFAPAPYLAWEQDIMGWTEVQTLAEDARGITVLPLTEEGGQAYKIQNPENDRDCIYMENVQQRGLNYKAAGHGLLVYHVAYPNSTVNMGDSPNNKAGRPAVSVVPADSLLIAIWQRDSYPQYGGTYTLEQYTESFLGDPFPGTGGVTVLTDSMRLPNYQFYTTDGTAPVGCSLRDISEDAATGAVTFSYFSGNVSSGIRTVRPSDLADHRAVYDLQGRRVRSSASIFDRQAAALPKGIYISNGKTIVIR